MFIVKLGEMLGIRYLVQPMIPLMLCASPAFSCVALLMESPDGRKSTCHTTMPLPCPGLYRGRAVPRQNRSCIFRAASLNRSCEGWDYRGTKKRVACATRKVKRMTF